MHRFANDRGIGTEAPLPAAVAQDGDRMRVRRRIFLGQKFATEKRFHAEDVEVIAGDEITPDALVVAAVAQAADDDAVNARALTKTVLRSR